MLSAPLFQLVIMPFKSFVMIASCEILCYRAQLSERELCVLPVAEFGKQQIDGGVKGGDGADQQQADENEGNK